jgi:hypothetical protein
MAVDNFPLAVLTAEEVSDAQGVRVQWAATSGSAMTSAESADPGPGWRWATSARRAGRVDPRHPGSAEAHVQVSARFRSSSPLPSRATPRLLNAVLLTTVSLWSWILTTVAGRPKSGLTGSRRSSSF